MKLHDQIHEEMVGALKAKDQVRLTVLRGLLTSFMNELVASKRKPDEKLDDKEVIAVIKRAVKQREDSIEQFTKGNRPELAENEKKEHAILVTYLPETMSRDKIEVIARAKKEELGIDDKAKMGVLMGAVMKETKGEADGKDVREVIESLFD